MYRVAIHGSRALIVGLVFLRCEFQSELRCVKLRALNKNSFKGKHHGSLALQKGALTEVNHIHPPVVYSATRLGHYHNNPVDSASGFKRVGGTCTM